MLRYTTESGIDPLNRSLGVQYFTYDNEALARVSGFHRDKGTAKHLTSYLNTKHHGFI